MVGKRPTRQSGAKETRGSDLGPLHACASVFPVPTRQGDENSRNPFAAASPRDSCGLTVAAVWLLLGDQGRQGFTRVRARNRARREGIFSPIADSLTLNKNSVDAMRHAACSVPRQNSGMPTLRPIGSAIRGHKRVSRCRSVSATARWADVLGFSVALG
jgi:hypothetical protein